MQWLPPQPPPPTAALLSASPCRGVPAGRAGRCAQLPCCGFCRRRPRRLTRHAAASGPGPGGCRRLCQQRWQRGSAPRLVAHACFAGAPRGRLERACPAAAAAAWRRGVWTAARQPVCKRGGPGRQPRAQRPLPPGQRRRQQRRAQHQRPAVHVWRQRRAGRGSLAGQGQQQRGPRRRWHLSQRPGRLPRQGVRVACCRRPCQQWERLRLSRCAPQPAAPQRRRRLLWRAPPRAGAHRAHVHPIPGSAAVGRPSGLARPRPRQRLWRQQQRQHARQRSQQRSSLPRTASRPGLAGRHPGSSCVPFTVPAASGWLARALPLAAQPGITAGPPSPGPPRLASARLAGLAAAVQPICCGSNCRASPWPAQRAALQHQRWRCRCFHRPRWHSRQPSAGGRL